MDILYFLKHSQYRNEEIRFSLRSVAKHFPFVRKIWIFGDCPTFLAQDRSLIEHVPHDQIAQAIGFPAPMTNFFQMLFASSLIPELAPEYLWFCDDFILTNELTLESARKLRYLEDLDHVQERSRGLWVDSLWRTYELLKRLDYPCLNFETHIPTYYRRRWVLDAYRDFKDYVTTDRWFGMLGPTAILNHAVKTNGLWPVNVTEEGTRAGFWGKAPTRMQLIEGCQGKQFLNFDDEAYGDEIHSYLLELFPDRCCYECSEKAENRFTRNIAEWENVQAITWQ